MQSQERKHYFIFVILKVLLTCGIVESSQQGCFEPSTPRTMTIAPGGYDPITGGASSCVQACQKTSITNYAGVTLEPTTSLTYCLCSASVPSQLYAQAAASCTNTCNDGQATCGVNSTLSIYEAPSSTADVQLSVDFVNYDGALEIDQSYSFTSIADDTNSLLMDFGEEAGRENVTTPASKSFASTGDFLVTTYVMDSSYIIERGSQSVRVRVEAPVSSAIVLCPEGAATYEAVSCNVTIALGTSMLATISYGDTADTAETFFVSDAPMLAYGPGIPGVITAQTTNAGAVTDYYLIDDTICSFSTNTQLKTVEYYASYTGTFNLMVMDWSSCGCISCTGGKKLNLVHGACAADSSAPDRASWLQTKVTAGMTVRTVTPITVTSTGPGTYTFPTPIDVNRCTFVAWSAGAGFTLAATNRKSSTHFLHTAPTQGESISGKTLVTNQFEPYIRVLASKASLILTSHTYTAYGVYDVVVNLTNTVLRRSVVNQTTVNVQEGINFTVFSSPMYGARLQIVTFTLEPHTGGNVTYVWNFGDGSSPVTTYTATVTHTYAISNEYTVNVTASNAVSIKENSTTIIILDAISGLMVTTPIGGSTAVPHVFYLNMTTGTDYLCTWNFDDGGLQDVTNSSLTPIAGSNWTHTFSQERLYLVNVTCSNPFNSESVIAQVGTLEAILNLKLVKEGAKRNDPFKLEFSIEEGGNVTFTVKYKGVVKDYDFDSITKIGLTRDTFTENTYAVHEVNIVAVNLVSREEITVNFTIDEPIGNPICLPGAFTLASIGEPVKFEVGVTSGTSVKIDWIYQDGEVDTYQHPLATPWTPGHMEIKHHTYAVTGCFHVIANITNSISADTCEHTVSVSNGSAGLNFLTNGPVPFVLHDVTGSKAEVWFTTGGCIPANTKVSIDWGDGTVSPQQLYQIGQNTIVHYYKDSKIFILKATFYYGNGGTDVLNTTFSVVEEITSFAFAPNMGHAAKGREMQICVTIGSGENVLLECDFGVSPPYSDSIFVKEPKFTELYCFNYTYTAVGTTDVTVRASNAVSNVSLTYALIIQEPVKTDCFILTQNPAFAQIPNDVQLELSLNASCTAQADVYVRVFYGDERSTNEEAIITYPKSWSLAYAQGGEYPCYVLVYNLASNASIYTTDQKCVTLIPLTAFSAENKYLVPVPVNGPPLPGFGSGKDTFPLGKELIFITSVTGSVQSYNVEAVSTDSAIHMCTFNSTDELVTTITQAGQYEVNITASNAMGSMTVTSSITMVEAPAEISFTQASFVGKKNKDITIGLRTGAIGTGSCYLLDYGDDETPTTHAYGNVGDCTALSITATNQGQWQEEMDVTHKYKKKGSYVFSICAYTPVLPTPLCQETTIIISKDECTVPSIVIDQPAPNFFTPKKQLKNQIFTVDSTIVLSSCESKLDNTKKWKIEKVDEEYGNSTGDANMAGLDLQYSFIKIPVNHLDVGLYKFIITVEFTASTTFSSIAVTYVRVVKPALVAGLLDGSTTEGYVGFNRTVKFEALRFSYDPDITVPEDRTQGIRCEFRCRRVSEAWPTTALNVPTRDWGDASIPYTLGYLMANSPPDNGGCFKQGPGLVNTSEECVLEFNTMNMMENRTYEIELTVKKDTRQTVTLYRMTVVEGDPPPASICYQDTECSRTVNGLKIRSPDNGLRLRQCCPNSGCDNDLIYNWRFFYHGFGETLIEDIRLRAYIQGTDSPAILITNKLFLTYQKLYGKFRAFRAMLTVKRRGGSTVNHAYTTLVVNEPPTGGNCDVEPQEGTPLTRFRVTCYDWYDDDGIDRMSLYGEYAPRSGGSLMERTMLTTGRPTIYTWEGPVPNGISATVDTSNVTLFVEITDILRGTTTYTIGSVTIRPPNITSTAEIDQMNSQVDQELISFDKLVKEGNVEASFDAINKVAMQLKILRYAADTSGDTCSTTCNSEDDPAEQKRSAIAEKREALIDATKYLPVAATVEGIQTQVSILREVSTPDEITLDSQMSLLGFTERVSASLSELELSKEKTVELAGPILQVIANSWQGTEEARRKPLNVDKERGKKSDYYFVDNYFGTSQQVMDDMKPNQASGVLMDDTMDRKIKGEVEDKGQEPSMTVLENVAVGILTQTVPGEEPTRIECGGITFTLEKNLVSRVTSRTTSVAYGVDVSIPPISTLDPNSTISSVQYAMKCNPYPKNKATKINTPVIIQDIFQNNVKMQVKDLDTSFVFCFNDNADDSCASSATPAPVTVNSTAAANVTYINCTGLSKCEQSVTVEAGYSGVGFIFKPKDRDTCFNVTTEWREPQRGRKGKAPRFNNIFESTLCFDSLNETGKEYHEWVILKRYSYKVAVVTHQVECGTQCTTAHDNITSIFGLASKGLNCVSRPNKGGKRWSQTDVSTVKEQGVCCASDHLSAFSGAFAVQPNVIDWDFVFANLDFFQNLTLNVTVILVFVIYVLAAVWARRADRKDVEKLGLSPLKDNNPEDKYYYEIHVVTGKDRNSGTDSKAFIILSGDYDESDGHALAVHGGRQLLKRGADDGLLLATSRPLGNLNYLRVWHDNSGRGKFASWYVRHIIIQDIQTKEKFFFLCDKWLAVEKGDGQVDRVLPVAGPEQLTEFSHLFSHTTGKKISDDHLWFSVVARPPESRFTRLQRVSCCLLLLNTNMLGNALFYGLGAGTTSNFLTLGPFSMSMEQLYIGMVTNLIVFPINFVVVQLFRKSPPRNKRKSRVEEALNKREKEKQEEEEEIGTSREQTAVISPTPRSATGIFIETKPTATYKKMDDKSKKKKKRCGMPWWGKVVAWLLLWAGVLASAFFVYFYGVQFGDTKCRKWITSMVVSFATSILLTQPLQVLLFAMLFSLIFKKPSLDSEEEEEDEEELSLQPDEQWEVPDPEDGYLDAKPRKIGYAPPDESILSEAREVRQKELKMYDVIREIIFYCIFLWLLLVVSYQFRPSTGYTQKQVVKDFFIDQGLSKVPTFTYNFMKARNHGQFWNWLNHTYLPSALATRWYNGAWLPASRGFLQDRANRIMGFSTLRQLRAKHNSCKMDPSFTTLIPECNDDYDFWNEEEGSYGVGWAPLGPNETAHPHYTYRRGAEINSYPFMAKHGFYSGGGYLVNLEGNSRTMQSIINQLREERWIDKYTRAVFIEFTTYNAGTNLFSIVTIVAEFVANGAMFPMFRVEPVALLTYYGPTAAFEIFCQVAYGLFILFYFIKEVRNLFREGKSYFHKFWNWVELLIVLLSMAGAGIFAYRLKLGLELTAIFKETKGDGYMKFQYIGYWQELLLYMIGILVFLGNLKFLKLLRFNRRMSMLASTLRVGAYPFLMFFIMFAFVYSAFVQYFYFIYLKSLNDFKTVVNSAETCMQMMLGRFDFDKMYRASEYLGCIGFAMYVIVCPFILINMFLTILNESFTRVRVDLELQSNEYELVDFMVHRMKCLIGMPSTDPTAASKPKEDEDGQEEDLYNTRAVNAPFESIEKFPEKVDKLLTCISKMIFFENLRDKMYNGEERLADILGLEGASGSDGKEVMRKMQSKEAMQRALAKMFISAKDLDNFGDVEKDFNEI